MVDDCSIARSQPRTGKAARIKSWSKILKLNWTKDACTQPGGGRLTAKRDDVAVEVVDDDCRWEDCKGSGIVERHIRFGTASATVSERDRCGG